MRDYKISVVIPTYNTWNLTRSCVNGIREHEEVDEIILVDDGSEKTFTPTLDHCRYIRLDKNVGFTLACNRGLEIATIGYLMKHIVFLISNDVQIKGKFVEQAAEILLNQRKSFVGNKMIGWDSGWNTFNGVTYGYLEGWFLAATAHGWKELNYFDPNYAPFDYEDMDISQTAKSKGYKLVALNNPNVIHQGGGTLGYNPEREAVTKRNREYFREKWVK